MWTSVAYYMDFRQRNTQKKRIKELDEHPELNKNGKISQEQAEKYFKYFVVFLLLATFIILAIHVSIYGGALIFPPLM